KTPQRTRRPRKEAPAIPLRTAHPQPNKRLPPVVPPQSLKAIREGLLSGQFRLEELVRSYLRNIESSKDLNIFLEVFEDEAIARAKAIDKKIDSGEGGRLAGMVVAIKDNIAYAGHKL